MPTTHTHPHHMMKTKMSAQVLTNLTIKQYQITALYSTAQHSTAQHSTVEHIISQYSGVQDNIPNTTVAGYMKLNIHPPTHPPATLGTSKWTRLSPSVRWIGFLQAAALHSTCSSCTREEVMAPSAMAVWNTPPSLNCSCRKALYNSSPSGWSHIKVIKRFGSS